MFACVVIDQDAKALNKEFDYLVPAEQKIEVGMRVKVPFGARVLQGFVIDLKENSNYNSSKIKPIIEPLEDFPIIKKEMIDLMKFMCEKYHLRMSSVLKLFVPSEIREGKVKELFEKWASISEDINLDDFKRAKKQLAIIESLLCKTATSSLENLLTNLSIICGVRDISGTSIIAVLPSFKTFEIICI